MSLAESLVATAVAVPFVLGLGAGGDRERPVEEFRFADPEIIESSGLVAREGLFATVNDSGDSARVFVVDPDSGETTGVVRWAGDPYDVEALAPLPDGGLLVGDIGDNSGRGAQRDSITLHEVPLARGGADVVEPTTYRLTYADGNRDAETLMVHPITGRVLVGSKGALGSRLYQAPARLRIGRINRLRAVADMPGWLTDGAFFPDGRHLALRDYSRMYVYSYPRLERIGVVRLPKQEQGEGLAINERGRVFVSTEGVHAAVHRVPLPKRITRAMAPPEPPEPTEPPASPDEEPTTGPAGTPDTDPDANPPEEPVGSDRRLWTWLLGAGIGLVMLVVLVRALRPR